MALQDSAKLDRNEDLQRAPKYRSTIRKSRDSTLSVREGGGGSLLRAARAGNVEKLTNLLDEENVDISTSNSSGLTALHLAAKEGHCSIINALLQRGASVNETTKRGNTALHIAALAGKLAVVELLIGNNANPNSQAQNAFTPLYMAAQEGHEVIVEYLLKHGANQSISTEDGFTPLAVALQEGKDKVVQLLLDNDVKGRVKLPALHIAARKDDVKAAALLLQNDNSADTTSKMMVNRTTESGFTALHIAAHYGNINVATLLLNRGAAVDFNARNNITPMHVAAKRGNTRLCALLLDRNGRADACTRDGLVPLHCAARSGHVPVVKLFLDCENTPRHGRTKNGLTALHMAAQGGHADVIEALLEKDFSVDDLSSDSLTALHIAAHCGHVDVAKLLLKHDAKINHRAMNGFTPLHVACKKEHEKIVELLLEYDTNIEVVTESGLTPLHIACFMGHLGIVKLLLNHQAEINTLNVRGETALHMATRNGKKDIVEYLLHRGAEPDARKQDSQTCLHLASRLNKLEIVKLLIKHGAVVDETMADGYTPLHVAAREGHVDICEALLDKKASVSLTTNKGFTALHLASKYGRLETANLLLRSNSSPDSCGNDGLTPLHVAAHFDNQQVALLLLKNGASPHASGKNGYTPLHIAAKKNQMEIAMTLLEYGASPNCKTRMDVTPLHLAAQEGHTDMCNVLLAKEANVNAQAKHGLSPMHLAAQEDRLSVAKVLYDSGGLADPLTKSGCTPLHVASHHGNIKVANYLLSLGAKVNAKTKNGYTPLHQASQQGHSHVVDLLLKHGASPNALTNSGNTALSLANRLGYVTVVDTLKTVTTETTTVVSEEKKKLNIPETVNEGFMSDASDDEGDESVVGGGLLSNTEMKELGDDSIVPTEASLYAVSRDAKYATLEGTPLTSKRVSWSSTSDVDNAKSPRSPRCNGFLVSFMVDARGGAMRGTRHHDLRVVVPPKSCRAPTRITCRFARRRHTSSLPSPSNPSLYDSEGNAARILEIGPRGANFLDATLNPRKLPPMTEGYGLASRVIQLAPQTCKFMGPVAVEIPHFAHALKNNRQIAVMRSNDGTTWKEHKWPCTDEQFRNQYLAEELLEAEKLAERRIFRIITTDFPRYFALVSRPIEDSMVIGAEGGSLESSVVANARVKFPEGSLTKKISVAIQVMPISLDVCRRAIGGKAKASSILTIEPRRRKFHQSIILTIPLPEGTDQKDYLSSSEDSTLRLLCSISGADDPAQWEDITGSSSLNFLDNVVTFPSTVSARFWLIDCRQPSESSNLAHQIYAEATRVPYMAKFIVFAKPQENLECLLRVYCLTDNKHERTLEKQEQFTEIARSKDIEMLEGSEICLEASGNLSVPSKSDRNHKFQFTAFNDNGIMLLAKVRDSTQEPCGRLTFFRAPLGPPKQFGPRKTLCNLNIQLPAYEKDSSESEEDAEPDEGMERKTQLIDEEATEAKKRYFLIDPATGRVNSTIAEAKHCLLAAQIGIQWPQLAGALGLSPDDVWRVQKECDGCQPGDMSLAMLCLWLNTQGDKATDEALSSALGEIGRDDLRPLLDDPVFEYGDVEPSANDTPHNDTSAFNALSDELGSPYPTPGHVSSPYPFLSAAQRANIATSTPIQATKARNETLTDAGPQSVPVPETPAGGVFDEEDDPNKPHFIYVADDDAAEPVASNVEKPEESADRDESRAPSSASSTSSNSDREENELSAPPSAADEEDDPDKPHFVYVPDEDEEEEVEEEVKVDEVEATNVPSHVAEENKPSNGATETTKDDGCDESSSSSSSSEDEESNHEDASASEPSQINGHVTVDDVDQLSLSMEQNGNVDDYDETEHSERTVVRTIVIQTHESSTVESKTSNEEGHEVETSHTTKKTVVVETSTHSA